MNVKCKKAPSGILEIKMEQREGDQTIVFIKQIWLQLQQKQIESGPAKSEYFTTDWREGCFEYFQFQTTLLYCIDWISISSMIIRENGMFETVSLMLSGLGESAEKAFAVILETPTMLMLW